ncbi:helix-turn-helix domain-containing protein [Streptomyces sp. NA04227]|uniref:helix-turn-helix domain-containing protein n=1 Tax=Streptomyces sp. NA04227 TaxID=2742136 RepID=UPI001591BDBE|nr:helix-turn-helix domain-containing protein [Streptomyces sp. NA04227]QKW05080.1 helix-turn-helix domain-containing protein [Streptomyces sp. NA04227]
MNPDGQTSEAAARGGRTSEPKASERTESQRRTSDPSRPDHDAFTEIDALLARSGPPAPLPSAERRREVRELLHLSQTDVARAVGVSAGTVRAWEAGREPAGESREKYAYFLDAAQERLAATDAVPAEPVRHDVPAANVMSAASVMPAGDAPPAVDATPVTTSASAPSPDSPQHGSESALAEPRPCVLCGGPARQEIAGFPQHLDPQECAAATAPQAADTDRTASAAAPELPVAESEFTPARAPRSRAGTPGPRGDRQVRTVPSGRRVQVAAEEADPIGEAVAAALEAHAGDLEAATAALVKRAIPDAMALLDQCRIGGRYDIVAHPWLPEVLRKQTARGADQIWEARPKWTRPGLPPGAHEVAALDVNGAYLSALKTHLPLGQLEHSTSPVHDRRRAGIHLIDPPDWAHGDELPHPLGSRDEPGPLWVGEPTLRLLLRLSGPKYGLCEEPRILESWTSGATEGLLEKFRVALKTARDRAIADDDTVTLEYVKAMYAKFVSTMGMSNYNRELYRPDWMHLIRSQAFANLWMKAHKAHKEGLLVVRAMGTDELHLAGDWRRVFAEGRGVAEVKVKDVYALGD